LGCRSSSGAHEPALTPTSSLDRSAVDTQKQKQVPGPDGDFVHRRVRLISREAEVVALNVECSVKLQQRHESLKELLHFAPRVRG
jgi:hypothetical protein